MASASRAPFEPFNTQNPRIAAAVAHAAATRLSIWTRSSTWSTDSPSPSPGGSDTKSATDSCDSMLRSPETRSNALNTTTAEPTTIIQPASVT